MPTPMLTSLTTGQLVQHLHSLEADLQAVSREVQAIAPGTAVFMSLAHRSLSLATQIERVQSEIELRGQAS